MQAARAVLFLAVLALIAGPALAEKPQGKPSAADLAKGKAVYDKNCGLCHNAGVAGALKLGDKAAWAPHLKMGVGHLFESALKGKGNMPAKGGHPELSEGDVKAAVLYMVEQSK